MEYSAGEIAAIYSFFLQENALSIWQVYAAKPFKIYSVCIQVKKDKEMYKTEMKKVQAVRMFSRTLKGAIKEEKGKV